MGRVCLGCCVKCGKDVALAGKGLETCVKLVAGGGEG